MDISDVIQEAARSKGARDASARELPKILGDRVRPDGTVVTATGETAVDKDGKPVKVDALVNEYLASRPHHLDPARRTTMATNELDALVGTVESRGQAMRDVSAKNESEEADKAFSDWFKKWPTLPSGESTMTPKARDDFFADFQRTFRATQSEQGRAAAGAFHAAHAAAVAAIEAEEQRAMTVKSEVEVAAQASGTGLTNLERLSARTVSLLEGTEVRDFLKTATFPEIFARYERTADADGREFIRAVEAGGTSTWPSRWPDHFTSEQRVALIQKANDVMKARRNARVPKAIVELKKRVEAAAGVEDASGSSGLRRAVIARL